MKHSEKTSNAEVIIEVNGKSECVTINLLRDGKIVVTGPGIMPMSFGKIHYSGNYAEAVKRGCTGMIGKAYITAQTVAEVSGLIEDVRKVVGYPEPDEVYTYTAAEIAAEQVSAKFAREMSRKNSDY